MTTPVQLATAAEFDSFQLPSEALKDIPTPVKDRALQWASRKALSYVAKRKVLPLVTWGDDLKAAVCELAGYYLVSRRGFAPNSGANEVIRESYEDAIAWLSDVSRGIAELVDCVDSSQDQTTDIAGPLVASDPIVNWNYQTRTGTVGSGFDG